MISIKINSNDPDKSIVSVDFQTPEQMITELYDSVIAISFESLRKKGVNPDLVDINDYVNNINDLLSSMIKEEDHTKSYEDYWNLVDAE